MQVIAENAEGAAAGPPPGGDAGGLSACRPLTESEQLMCESNWSSSLSWTAIGAVCFHADTAAASICYTYLVSVPARSSPAAETGAIVAAVLPHLCLE